MPRKLAGGQRQTDALTGARRESERHFRQASRWVTAAWILLVVSLVAVVLSYAWRHARHQKASEPEAGVQTEEALTEAGYDARLAKASIGFAGGLHSPEGPAAMRLAAVTLDSPPTLTLEVRVAPLPAIAIPGAAWHYAPAQVEVEAVRSVAGNILGRGALRTTEGTTTAFRFEPADDLLTPAVQLTGSLALNAAATVTDLAQVDARLRLRLPLETRRHTLQVRHLPKTVTVGDLALDLEQNGPTAILIRYRSFPTGLVAIVARDARRDPVEAQVQLAATAMEVRLARPAKTVDIYFTERFAERNLPLSLNGRLQPQTIDGIRAGREVVMGGATLHVEAASTPTDDQAGASDQTYWTLALHGAHQEVLWLGPVAPTGERRSVIDVTTEIATTVRRVTIGFLEGEGGSHLGLILAQPAP